MALSRQTTMLGICAAGASFLFSLLYTVAQLFEWAGLLGSAGGPNAASTPAGIAILLLPSLLLGPAWLATLAALHQATPASARALSQTALALGTAYAVLTGLVYFVQLTFVAPRLAAGETKGIELLLFVPYKSFLFAIDLYGYGLMCASALFAALALPSGSGFLPARPWLILTGLLTPALLFQMAEPRLIWAGALWGISFPVAALLLARGFARARADQDRDHSEP